MSDIYNIKIGGVVFSAKVNKTDANYEQVNRQFILLEILSKTINSRKSGSEAWLQDDDRAYDFAMEVLANVKYYDCFNCDIEHFEKVMQTLVNQKLIDYGKACHSGKGKKASAVLSGSFNFVSLESDTGESKKKPGGRKACWKDVIPDVTSDRPDEEAGIKDAANIVMQYLEKMDSLPKQCMLLHVQGLQNTEIAQLLGISNSYVGKLLKQTAKTIREELDSILEQLR